MKMGWSGGLGGGLGRTVRHVGQQLCSALSKLAYLHWPLPAWQREAREVQPVFFITMQSWVPVMFPGL